MALLVAPDIRTLPEFLRQDTCFALSHDALRDAVRAGSFSLVLPAACGSHLTVPSIGCSLCSFLLSQHHILCTSAFLKFYFILLAPTATGEYKRENVSWRYCSADFPLPSSLREIALPQHSGVASCSFVLLPSQKAHVEWVQQEAGGPGGPARPGEVLHCPHQGPGHGKQTPRQSPRATQILLPFSLTFHCARK